MAATTRSGKVWGVMGLAAIAVAAADAHAQDDSRLLVADADDDEIIRYQLGGAEALDLFTSPAFSHIDGVGEILFGPDGGLYAVSTKNNVVLRYEGQTGQGVRTWTRDGDLDGPRGIAFDDDGLMYVSDDSNRVLRFGTAGSFMDVFVEAGVGGLAGPRGMAFDADGNLCVASYDDDRVLRFDGNTGDYLDDIVPAGAAGLDGPVSVVIDEPGRVYVAGAVSGTAVVVPVGGVPEVLVVAHGGAPLGQMTIDPNTNGLLVTSRSPITAVGEYDRLTGSFEGVRVINGVGGVLYPMGVAVMPPEPCEADFDGDGSLTIFDFLAFQNAFDLGCP